MIQKSNIVSREIYFQTLPCFSWASKEHVEDNASNIIVLYLENIFQSVRENIFMKLEDGSALKISYHSCGRTQFALQHPHWTAHSTWHIWCCCSQCTPTHRHIILKQSFKMTWGAEKNDWAVKSISCSCRQSEFSSQHPAGISQLSVSPGLGEFSPFFWFLGASGTHVVQYIHAGRHSYT